VVGMVNVGIVLGLLQFVSTVAVVAAYAWFTARRIDGPAAAIRARCARAAKRGR